jgi:hypothetical protein
MMDDSEIRQRFAQLREDDQENVPSFAQTYGHARASRRLRATLRGRPFVIGAAAVIAIAALSLVYGRSSSPSVATPTIATWRAPTDVLLRTPGSELLGEMPALGASVLDTMIPKPSNRGT